MMLGSMGAKCVAREHQAALQFPCERQLIASKTASAISARARVLAVGQFLGFRLTLPGLL